MEEPKKSKWDLLWLLLLVFPIALVISKIEISEVNSSNFLHGCSYDDSINDVNKDIFYINKGQVQAADPDVITYDGKYYLYATNANGNADCSYLQCWSSTNLTDWTLNGKCYQPDLRHWCIDGLWAPEVIEKDGTFYLYYAGWSLKRGIHEIGVATSKSPTGPFIDVDTKETPFDFGFTVIDPSPFIDDDGQAYLLATKDQVQGVSSSYIVKLNDDMVSADMSTLTLLAKPEIKWETSVPGNKWNEAPYMFKHNGLYFLFYSANYYQDREYSIGVATSDNPFGPFTKYEKPLLQAFDSWDYISGTGHCSIFPSIDNKEYFIAYHSHKDTITGGSERLIKFDRITFMGNKIHVNGPSISPQPLPSGSSKYSNIVNEGEVRVNGGRVNFLTDSYINYDDQDLSMELNTHLNSVQITVKFDEPKCLRAVMLYDSANYDKALRSVKRLTISDKKAIDLPISSTYLDTEYYYFKTPMSAFIYEFDEIMSDSIIIDLISDVEINLNELVVLGK